MAGSFVDPHSARSDDYREQLQEISAAGVCPFCPEHFHKWHPYPILESRQGWLITRARENYPNADLHLLLICERHVESTTQLLAKDWLAIGGLVNWAVRAFNIDGGALALRFGPTQWTGATVQHLHAHLIQPILDPTTQRAKVVNFPIG